MALTSQKGFTLLELLLVVGIASVLIIGSITTYSLVTLDARINSTVNLVEIIQAKTHVMAINSPTYGTYGDAIEPLLVNTQSIPKKYVTDTGLIMSPISTIPLDVHVGFGDAFTKITLTMPPAYIPRVAARFVTQTQSELDSMSICGSIAFSPGDVVPTAAQMSDACGSSTAETAGDLHSILVLRTK